MLATATESFPLLSLLVAALLAPLGWRRPTLLFLLALASLAVRPEAIFGGAVVGTGWVVQQSLVVGALAFNALRYGVRRTVNWPVLALALVFALSPIAGEPHPGLTLGYMAGSLVVLALPWLFPQVVLEPGSRQRYAATIAGVAPLSVALGAVLHLAGLRTMYGVDVVSAFRLIGATGTSADLALLAFAGFAVALHESTRTRNRWLTGLTGVNLIIVILTGARTALAAGAVLLVGYLLLVEPARARLRENRAAAALGGGAVALVLALYLPDLLGRTFAGGEWAIRMTGRDALWSFYLTEFLASPIFGRGVGAGFVAYASRSSWLPTPHNEYLHLLVSGGVVGLILCLAAIGLWFRQLLGAVRPGDRGFLWALIPALALYAATDNVLTLPAALPIFVHLGVLRTRSAVVAAPAAAARRHRRRHARSAGDEAEPGRGGDEGLPSRSGLW